jgi:DNA/RNA non-specific endonuclease
MRGLYLGRCQAGVPLIALSNFAVPALKGRVLVPTHLFKAVYVPSRNLAAAYWSPNDASGTWGAISIAELQKRTGIDAFPGIAQEVKDKVVGVPEPVSHYRCRLEHAQSRRSSEVLSRYDDQRAPHFEFSH